MGKNYNQLSIEERAMMQAQLETGVKPAAIAKPITRSASTVSRELRRNFWSHPKTSRGPGRPIAAGGYRAEAAHKRAPRFPIKPRVEGRLRPGTTLWDSVMRRLKAGYSPEQIAGTLALVHPDTPTTLQVSHETLYTDRHAACARK